MMDFLWGFLTGLAFAALIIGSMSVIFWRFINPDDR